MEASEKLSTATISTTDNSLFMRTPPILLDDIDHGFVLKSYMYFIHVRFFVPITIKEPDYCNSYSTILAVSLSFCSRVLTSI